jgi:hypothetical protein
MEQRRGQVPGRCGTCAEFKDNGSNCPKLEYIKGESVLSRVRFANDYGEGYCKNYKKAV